MRTIDADDFFKTFPEIDTEPYNNFQTIDAVPVIRCKDCKWFTLEIDFHGLQIGTCPYQRPLYNQTYGEGYCFRGERKESEGEDNGKV